MTKNSKTILTIITWEQYEILLPGSLARERAGFIRLAIDVLIALTGMRGDARTAAAALADDCENNQELQALANNAQRLAEQLRVLTLTEDVRDGSWMLASDDEGGI